MFGTIVSFFEVIILYTFLAETSTSLSFGGINYRTTKTPWGTFVPQGGWFYLEFSRLFPLMDFSGLSFTDSSFFSAIKSLMGFFSGARPSVISARRSFTRSM